IASDEGGVCRRPSSKLMAQGCEYTRCEATACGGRVYDPVTFGVVFGEDRRPGGRKPGHRLEEGVYEAHSQKKEGKGPEDCRQKPAEGDDPEGVSMSHLSAGSEASHRPAGGQGRERGQDERYRPRWL